MPSHIDNMLLKCGIVLLLMSHLLTFNFFTIVAGDSIGGTIGPRIEIKPSLPVVLFEAQAISNKVLTCKALGDKPGMFNLLRWSGPNRSDNWQELLKRHKVKESTRNGHSLELEFLRPTPDDSGVYYCHGTYQSSDVYNASVEVKVYNPIKLENCPDRQFVVEGSRGQKITCRITGDSPNVVFLKDGVPIDQLDKRYKWDNEDGLVIMGEVNRLDAGVYTIEVTTDMTGDRRVQPIVVEVHSKPEIVPYNPSAVESFAEFYGVEGDKTELKCEVTGNPRPLVYWLDPHLRNLTHVGGYFVNHEEGKLLISHVNKERDHGNFQCIAYNNVGRTSRNVSMAALERPAITSFINQTVLENEEVTFECRSTGFPRPQISIRRQGLNQIPFRIGDGNVTDVSEEEEGGGARAYIYRLKIRADRSHFGLYYCNASNIAGGAEKVAQLSVKHAPDLSLTPPEQFVRLGRNITVTCHIKAFPAPQITWMADTQQIVNIGNSGFRTSPDEQTHIVTMMPPPSLQMSSVRYRCRAQNDIGTAEKIITPRFTTAPGVVNAVVLETTPTTVKLQLTISNDGGDRVRAFLYKVEGVTMDSMNPLYTYPIDRRNESYIDASPTKSTYTIRNLYPFYRYKISIRAVNDVGVGDINEVHAETRRPDRPEAPIIIKPASVITSSVGFPSEYQNGYLLKWNPPESDNGDPVIRYKIKFFKIHMEHSDMALDGIVDQKTIEQMSERPLHTRIGPLETNRRYKIQLQAENKYGVSDASQITVYTPVDRPAMPDFGPQALAWLTEPSAHLLFGLLGLAITALIIIDLLFCFCYHMGITHYLSDTKFRSKR